MDYFATGEETAQQTPKGAPDVEVGWDVDGLTAYAVIQFIDGFMKVFEERGQSIKGIRLSHAPWAAIQASDHFDVSREKYRGTPVVFSSSFFPNERIEIVTGP